MHAIFTTLMLSMALSAALTVALSKSAFAQDLPFSATPVADLNEPWALTSLPDGRLLITEKSGSIQLVTPQGEKAAVLGAPGVDYYGQGGLGDITLHPEFASNGMVYISYVESGANDTRGAVVARGILNLAVPAITNLEVVWRAFPKVDGGLHYGHRILFDNEGYMFVSSGERNKRSPAQDLNTTLGKIVRLTADGRPAPDNPFAEMGGVAAQVWTYGHRNPLGLDIDSEGRLWNIEMGPRGGDELNLLKAGTNYGFPHVSNGSEYNGTPIPDHSPTDPYEPPQEWWNPSISPSSFIFYEGDAFQDFNGDALITGLSSNSIVHVEMNDDGAAEVARYDMGRRIRGIEQGPDGHLWVIEDGADGRLLRLSPQ